MCVWARFWGTYIAFLLTSPKSGLGSSPSVHRVLRKSRIVSTFDHRLLSELSCFALVIESCIEEVLRKCIQAILGLLYPDTL